MGRLGAVTAQFEARTEPAVLPVPVTGGDLRRFREEKGVTLGEIASSSKVGVRYLRYIEDEVIESALRELK